MTDKKKPTAKGRLGNGSRTNDTSNSPAELLEKAPSKIARVLAYLRHVGTLNRFEAARLVGDTCLNSTIPVLENRYGVPFEHLPEKSPNNWGEPCDCTRYRLPASAYDRADKALALLYRKKQQRAVA